MFIVNRFKLEAKTKLVDSKVTRGEEDIETYGMFKKIMWNIIDTVKEFNLYEMAHWINFKDRWILNRTVTNQKSYKRGEILFVDLGASNFRFEPSFTHPCIVLINRKTSLLVVPCSSKKYGKGYWNIIDAEAGVDGFAKDTGIQIEEFRWINKNRVISKMGKVSPDVLNKVDEYMLNIIPSYKKILRKIEDLELENTNLHKEIEKLNQENSKLTIQLEELNKKNE